MRDKWKEPILKNTEDQFAWTMAYDTGCGPLDLFISGWFQAGKYIVFVLLTMYVNMKNARNEKRLHSTTGQPAENRRISGRRKVRLSSNSVDYSTKILAPLNR